MRASDAGRMRDFVIHCISCAECVDHYTALCARTA
jgi:hypothetical protein